MPHKSTVYYLLLLISLLWGCREKTTETVQQLTADTLHHAPAMHTTTDTVAAAHNALIPDVQEDYVNEPPLEEPAFTVVDLEFSAIAKKDFDGYVQAYEKKNKKSPVMDASGNIQRLGIFIKQECDAICEASLKETKSGKEKHLPSNFDQGILGLSFSPDMSRMLVYSSYDGPDYADYYGWRAELYTYTVEEGRGVNGIVPDKCYYANDWSIAQIVWINETTLALKIYEEARWGDGSKVAYQYVKTVLK